MIYRHKEPPHLVQLSPELPAVNELRPYPGWDGFLRDRERAWTDLRSVLPEVAVKRIGLCYINRVARSSAEEPVSTWLDESVYYPKKILALTSRFLRRFEFAVSPGFRSIITIGDASEGEEAETRFLLLDLDSVVEGTFPPE